MAETLFHKVWNAHAVRTLPSGQTQLFVGLHLVHEVTTPQAFDMLRQQGGRVAFPERTFATIDHIVPTRAQQRPFLDVMAEEMATSLERNCRDAGIPLWTPDRDEQGIVHVIGPELGLTQPGMTIACGDSHTSTHGALGAIAFGIGTSQVRDVLASQCLALDPLKVRRIDVTGSLRRGVYAKDVILTIIRRLGVQGGVGHAYEYGGATIDAMTLDERMTICNMSIEGGARVGYVNPDDTTFTYLRGRPFAPQGAAFDRAVGWWRQIASDRNASYDDRVSVDATTIEPTVTWGINPGQSVGVGETIEGDPHDEAFAFMGFRPGARVTGTKIDVAFIGSCTNGRLSDLEEAARIVKDRASRRTSRRWSYPARRASAARPRRAASIACSSTPASSGAARAARCASA
jgi:3-isopropylmalate/(R)-2-methylmalate dehydratase large subunit